MKIVKMILMFKKRNIKTFITVIKNAYKMFKLLVLIISVSLFSFDLHCFCFYLHCLCFNLYGRIGYVIFRCGQHQPGWIRGRWLLLWLKWVTPWLWLWCRLRKLLHHSWCWYISSLKVCLDEWGRGIILNNLVARTA